MNELSLNDEVQYILHGIALQGMLMVNDQRNGLCDVKSIVPPCNREWNGKFARKTVRKYKYF